MTEATRRRQLRDAEHEALLETLLAADAADDGDHGHTMLLIPDDVLVGGLKVDEHSLDWGGRMASRRDIAQRLIDIRETRQR